MFPGPGPSTEDLTLARLALSLEANHQARGTLLTTFPDPWSYEGQPPPTCATLRGKKIAYERRKEQVAKTGG